MFHPLHSCLHPRTIALIGLTDDPSDLVQPLQALLAAPFTGTLLPIHATQARLCDLPTYPDLDALPDRPDLVIVSLVGLSTANALVKVIHRCIARGFQAVFLHSPPQSIATFQPLVKQAVDSLGLGTRPEGIRLFGPSEGFSNPITGCHLIDGPAPNAGRVGLLAPTAAWLEMMVQAAYGTSVGFSTCVAVGMETDVGYHDYLSFFSEDVQTQVIVLLYEPFKQPQQVLQVLHQVALNKPVLLYPLPAPVATNDANPSSVNIHTLTQGLFHQAGVLVVDALEQMIPLAETLLQQPLTKGARVAVLADQPESVRLAQAALLKHRLLLADGSTTPQAPGARRMPTAAFPPPVVDATVTLADRAAARLVEEAVDAVLVVSRLGYAAVQGSPEATAERHAAARLARLAQEADKPLVIQSSYQPLQPNPLYILQQRGIPVHHTVEQAVTHLAYLVKAGRAQQRIRATLTEDLLDVTSRTWENIQVTPGGRGSLLESEARELLKAHGIMVPPHFMARRPADLGRAARQFGDQPVVMKIVSRDILRKSEAGCVLLNVQGEADMGKAYGILVKKALAYAPRADVRGVLVTPMAPPGVELAIGMTRHTSFGPVMRIELLSTSPNLPAAEAFRSLPLHSVDAEDVLMTLRDGALLKATPPIDHTALIQMLILLSRLCLGHPEIVELELSSVFAHADGYTIADACMILTEDPHHSAQPLKGSPDMAAADAPTVLR